MFTLVEQGTKHPEAGPRNKCTQMFTVVIYILEQIYKHFEISNMLCI